MKIDLEKLKEVELKYGSPAVLPGDIHISNELSLFTLQQMVKIVLDYNESTYLYATSNVKLAFETLKSLGVIVEDIPTEPKIQQLNS
jgi:hypothetical protein